jgi:uncharacterized protein
MRFSVDSVRSLFGPGGRTWPWKTLLFVGLYVGMRIATGPLLGPLIVLSDSEPNPPEPALIRESWSVLLVFAATWVMGRIEGRSVFEYGFRDPAKMVRFASGVAWGFVCLSVLVGAIWLHGSLSFAGFSLSGAAAWRYGIAWAMLFTLVGLAEESELRGYLQYTLARGVGFWWAAFILSIVFTLLHAGLAGESLLGLVDDFSTGMVFCLSLRLTGSLYWAIGFHAGWDWTQSFFYGTPDSGMLIQGHLLTTHAQGDPLWSGGLTGPEGSLFELPVPLLLGLGMWLWWGRRNSHTAPEVIEG